MNLIDLGVLILVALCAFAGYKRGLIRTVYRLVSFFIAMFLANQLYGPVARLLRNTSLFPTIQNSIKNALNLENVTMEHTANRSFEIIESLPLPENLREMLHNNNNTNMHELLQVGTIEDYISGFFANMVINGIAIVAVFLLVFVGLSIAGVALDIVSKLPIINTFNRAGGLIFGLLLGGVITWISLVIMSLLFASGQNVEMFEMMQGSFVARWVLDSMMPQLINVS